MATKSTLENANIALKAQMETLMAQMQALTAQAHDAPKAKPTKPAVPLVTRGYFKREDPTTGKWVDNPERPCVIVTVEGAKPEKMTAENFTKRYITHHAKIVAAFNALA